MPQGYGKPRQDTRPTPSRLRQDLGYVPARAMAEGDGGGGITSTGGPSAPVLSLTPISTGKFLGNLTGADAVPGPTNFTFINLTDVPPSYTGHAGQSVRVNATSSALEFFTPAAAVSSQWIPLVNGAEPPALISDGSGHLILVAQPL